MGTRRLAPRTDGARPAPDRWSTRRGGAAPLAPARLQPWAPETARWSAEVPGAAGGEPGGSAVRTTHDTTLVDPAAEWMTCQVIAVNGGSGLVTGLRMPRGQDPVEGVTRRSVSSAGTANAKSSTRLGLRPPSPLITVPTPMSRHGPGDGPRQRAEHIPPTVTQSRLSWRIVKEVPRWRRAATGHRGSIPDAREVVDGADRAGADEGGRAAAACQWVEHVDQPLGGSRC